MASQKFFSSRNILIGSPLYVALVDAVSGEVEESREAGKSGML